MLLRPVRHNSSGALLAPHLAYRLWSPRLDFSCRMNPFGIVQAVLTLIEGVAHAANPKRQGETKKERRRFLFFYCAFMLLGIAVVVWTIWSLYFVR